MTLNRDSETKRLRTVWGHAAERYRTALRRGDSEETLRELDQECKEAAEDYERYRQLHPHR